jgi:hypothetical protein
MDCVFALTVCVMAELVTSNCPILVVLDSTFSLMVVAEFDRLVIDVVLAETVCDIPDRDISSAASCSVCPEVVPDSPWIAFVLSVTLSSILSISADILSSVCLISEWV